MATKSSTDDRLAQVKADYSSWFNHVKPYRTKWDNYWKLWNNERINQQYWGDNDSFDPETFQKVETIVDNVYGTRPKLTFLPTRKDQEHDTKILSALFDYTWDKNNMDERIIPFGREVTVTGNGLFFLSWEDGYMCIKHVPIRDCILDPTASHPDDMRFVGYRRLTTLKELRKERRYDADRGWVPKYTGLDDVATWTGGQDDKTDKELKDCYAGSTLGDEDNAKKEQVEVIYLAYPDKIVETANRMKVVAEYDNPYHKDAYKTQVQLKNEQGEAMYDESSVGEVNLPPLEQLPPDWEQMTPEDQANFLGVAPTATMIEVEVPEIKPFLPFVMGREFTDPALLLAKGDVEPFAQVQEDLNDTLNATKDAIGYTVRPITVVDTLAEESIPELAQAKFGSVIAVQGGVNNVQQLAPANSMIVAASENEMNRAKKSISDTARVDPVVQGVSTQNDRTATEINAQVAQATGGFSTKQRSLEAGTYSRLGLRFRQMVQIFLTKEQAVRVIGKEGAEFKNFDPAKFWGDYDEKVVLESAAKAQAKQDADKAIQMMQMFGMDPAFNSLELKKLVLRRVFEMDDDDMEAILADPRTTPVSPMQMQAPMPGQMPQQSMSQNAMMPHA